MLENRKESRPEVLDFTGRTEALSQSFMSNVFSYMTLALLISGAFAWWFGTTDLIQSIIRPEGGMTMAGWVVTLAPFAFILLMNFKFESMSPSMLLVIFLAFAAVMGISLSYIFVVYDLGFISTTFLITAGTFGTMAVVGYRTKTDLTKFGSILYMALIGIIIAMVVNWFIGSSMMDYIISCIGVLIFTGLTAYDTQKIKRIGQQVEYGTGTATKLAIMGATSLYLDFINLFLFLLRVLSSRD